MYVGLVIPSATNEINCFLFANASAGIKWQNIWELVLRSCVWRNKQKPLYNFLFCSYCIISVCQVSFILQRFASRRHTSYVVNEIYCWPNHFSFEIRSALHCIQKESFQFAALIKYCSVEWQISISWCNHNANSVKIESFENRMCTQRKSNGMQLICDGTLYAFLMWFIRHKLN